MGRKRKNEYKCILCGGDVTIGSNGYYKSYCTGCKKERDSINKEKRRSKFIYFFKDINDKILYIGQTDLLGERVSSHLRGSSHLKVKGYSIYDLIHFYKLRSVYFVDLSDIVMDKEELIFIENQLLKKYETPILNSNYSIIDLPEQRKKILNYYVDNNYIENDMIPYNITKYLGLYLNDDYIS